MAQKLLVWDIVSLVLTILATSLQCFGYFYPHWWEHVDGNDVSFVSMLTMTICDTACYSKSVLSFEKDTEWIFASRVFGLFGVVFVVIALIVGILMVFVRRRAFNSAIVYLLATAALFILMAVIVFGAFHTGLDNKMVGEGKLLFTGIGVCTLAALLCIASSVVAGFALSKHLQQWDDDDDDDD